MGDCKAITDAMGGAFLVGGLVGVVATCLTLVIARMLDYLLPKLKQTEDG